VFGGLGYTALANLDAALGWQYDVNKSNTLYPIEDFPRFIAQIRLTATLGKGFPQYIGQETHEDVVWAFTRSGFWGHTGRMRRSLL